MIVLFFGFCWLLFIVVTVCLLLFVVLLFCLLSFCWLLFTVVLLIVLFVVALLIVVYRCDCCETAHLQNTHFALIVVKLHICFVDCCLSLLIVVYRCDCCETAHLLLFVYYFQCLFSVCSSMLLNCTMDNYCCRSLLLLWLLLFIVA